MANYKDTEHMPIQNQDSHLVDIQVPKTSIEDMIETMFTTPTLKSDANSPHP